MANILVVEDDESIREVMQIALSDLGHRMVEAATEDRLQNALKQSFDLVFVDIRVGSLSGKEIITMIKGKPSYENTPVVLFSADDQIDTLAQEVNAAGVLKKPFTLDALSETLSLHLS